MCVHLYKLKHVRLNISFFKKLFTTKFLNDDLGRAYLRYKHINDVGLKLR